MDPARNPFNPGAGTQPPALVGRDRLVESARIALARISAGRSGRSQMLLGLRGVGKTVLLNRIHEMALDAGFETVLLEAPEERRLAEMIVPPLRSVLFRLSHSAKAADAARRALGALRAFASAFRVKVGDVEFGVDPAVGTADSGALDFDLTALFMETGNAAKAAGKPIALLVDEVQYLGSEDLSALIVALHRASQRQLPLILFGAGLPQLAGLAGEAKSYAERLFEYPPVGSLDNAASRAAIERPLADAGARIDAGALASIVRETQGYPYFLQEWGSSAWDVAMGPVITSADVRLASTAARARLDAGFFRVRLDRLSPRERDYLAAMAALGPGPHRSGEIAARLGVDVRTAGPIRSGLIAKGMIFSQQYGETAFTVPMFDEFLRRALPALPSTNSSGRPSRGGRRPRRKR